MHNIYYQLVVILYNTTMHMHRVRARMQIMHTHHVLLLSNTSQQSILSRVICYHIYIYNYINNTTTYHQQYYHTRKKYAQQYSIHTLVCIICIIICILARRVQTMHSTTTTREYYEQQVCIACTQYDVLHHIDRSTWEHSVDKSEF